MNRIGSILMTTENDALAQEIFLRLVAEKAQEALDNNEQYSQSLNRTDDKYARELLTKQTRSE